MINLGAHTSGEDNPFTHFYAALASQADSGGNALCEIQIYYHVVLPKTGSSEGGKYRREPKVMWMMIFGDFVFFV